MKTGLPLVPANTKTEYECSSLDKMTTWTYCCANLFSLVTWPRLQVEMEVGSALSTTHGVRMKKKNGTMGTSGSRLSQELSHFVHVMEWNPSFPTCHTYENSNWGQWSRPPHFSRDRVALLTTGGERGAGVEAALAHHPPGLSLPLRNFRKNHSPGPVPLGCYQTGETKCL